MTIAHLICVASALPNDSSALESAISALERAITTLDNSSAFWEGLAPWFTGAVVVGVVAEVVFIVHEHKDNMAAWARGIIRPPDRPSGRWLALEIIATVLIALGVAGELGIGIAIARINGQLRIKNTELRSKSDQLLALVTQEAGNAEASAQGAAQAASEAITSAGEAKGKAGAASRTAGAANDVSEKAKVAASDAATLAEKTKSDLINLALCNAPRVLPLWTMGNGKTSVDPLRSFAGHQVIVEFVPDAEARRAAFNIAESLNSAGWKILRLAPVDGIDDGVEVQPFQPSTELGHIQKNWADWSRASAAADAIVDFLHSYNWQATRAWPLDEKGAMIHDPKIIPPGAVRIRVGLYPPIQFIAPPGAKDLASAVAQFQQQREKTRMDAEAKMLKKEEEIINSLPTEQAREDFKARREEWNQSDKLLNERHSSPCQPLQPLTPSLR